MSRMWMAAMVLSLLGCAAEQVRQSNDTWSQGVVVARQMCAQNHSIQHSNDPEGRRAYCALEDVLGTHLQKCVCRDERQAAQEREAAQQYLREAEQARQLIVE